MLTCRSRSRASAMPQIVHGPASCISYRASCVPCLLCTAGEWTSQQCLDPSECTISWQSVSGVDTSGVAIFEPDGPESCVFTLTISYSLPGWLTPVATSPLARTFVNSSVNTTVERFKAAIEAESAAATIAAEIDALSLEATAAAAAASGRATRATTPGGFYTTLTLTPTLTNPNPNNNTNPNPNQVNFTRR